MLQEGVAPLDSLERFSSGCLLMPTSLRRYRFHDNRTIKSGSDDKTVGFRGSKEMV